MSGAHHRLADTETRMVGVLDELELTGLVTSITGISPVGAAAILAQTGDPSRFATARALVKHAGLAPARDAARRESAATAMRRPGRSKTCGPCFARRCPPRSATS